MHIGSSSCKRRQVSDPSPLIKSSSKHVGEVTRSSDSWDPQKGIAMTGASPIVFVADTLTGVEAANMFQFLRSKPGFDVKTMIKQMVRPRYAD